MTVGSHWSTGAGFTDQGPRARNEDAYLSRGNVHIVADGMGGHHAGAAASAAVVETFEALADLAVVTPAEVAAAVVQAQRAVLEVSLAVGGESGTTVTGAVAVEHDGGPWWMIINVGDSRTYLVDGDTVHQVTRDHSHVQDLVDAGRITAEEAERHPDRNIVTRAIGDGLTEFDAWLVPVMPGMRLVVASDGLTKVVSDAQIGATAGSAEEPATAASALVSEALALGTGDNVTVVVADVLDAVTPPGLDVSPWRLWGEQWEPGADDGFDDDTTQTSQRRARV